MSAHGSQLFNLDGRVALVTGAAGYVGSALASALAEAGATVWLNGRNEAKLTALAERLTSAGYRARALTFDITDESATSAAVSHVDGESGRLDVLVNNAHQPRSGSFTDANRSDFTHAAELALSASYALTIASLPLLERAAADSSPCVVNVASIYGMVSPDPRNYLHDDQQNPPYYGAAKAGLLQLTRHAATHLAPRGIRVNALSPGAFPAGAPANDPGMLDRLANRVPLGRVGTSG